MRARLAVAAVIALTATCWVSRGSGVFAQAPAAEAKPAKPHKTLKVLTADEVDPAKLLPAPPLDGSQAQRAELDELRRIQASRTPERLEQARWDGDHEDATAFAEVLGPKFDLSRLPATRALLAIVQNDQSVAASEAKKRFHRHRPWIFDPALQVCEAIKPNPQGGPGDPLTSYPSGHSTLGYALGVVLADLVPTKAAAILSRSSDYAYSRLVCEVHFRSDIVAGQALGTAVGAMLLQTPALQPQIESARQELAAAGIGAAN